MELWKHIVNGVQRLLFPKSREQPALVLDAHVGDLCDDQFVLLVN